MAKKATPKNKCKKSLLLLKERFPLPIVETGLREQKELGMLLELFCYRDVISAHREVQNAAFPPLF